MSNSNYYPPKREKITAYKKLELLLHHWLQVVLFIIMILSAVHIAIFYVFSFWGLKETISEQYAIYIAIGTYFCLVVYRNAMKAILGHKTKIEA